MRSRITALVDTAIGQLLAGLMGLAVINVVWQVVSRYVLQSPSAYTEELARFLLIWIGLLGSAYAVGRQMHLAIDLLPQALDGPARRRLDRLVAMLIILFALTVLVWGGSRLVWVTLYLGQRSAAMGVPLGYVYVAIPVSGLFMIYYAVVRFFQEEP